MTVKKTVPQMPFWYNQYLLTDMNGCIVKHLSLEDVQEDIESSWGDQEGLCVIYKGKIHSVTIEKKLVLKEI